MSARSRRIADRRRGREAALQMLYQWEVGRAPVEEVLETYRDLRPLTEAGRDFAASLVRGTIAHLGTLDPLISGSVRGWRLERLAIIDRLILRLAVYELAHSPETPPAVVIDEALGLAKRFSVGEAVAFINGVLDDVRRRLEKDT